MFTTCHLQVPCAVERLIGKIVKGFALLGMFCPQKGVDPPAKLYSSECFVRSCAFGFFQCTCRVDPPVELHSSGCFAMKSWILMAFCVKGWPESVLLQVVSAAGNLGLRLKAIAVLFRCRVVVHFIRGMN